jgi:hypothetical protein
MTQIADLIRAVAALLWPLFAFYALYRFGPEIKNLVARLKKGKLLGQEIELGESLDRLDRTASAVASEVAAVPQLAPAPPPEASDEGEVVQRVFAAAAQSPKAALLLLAAEIEKQVRQLLASMGLLKGRKNLPLQGAFVELDEWGGLPKHIAASVKLFWDVRNRLVHGHSAGDGDILRAIDSGITILRALQAIPHEVNTVYHPGVPIYADPECRKEIEGARGVILETVSPGGVTKTRRIFPTTRTHFKKGVRVAWEWSDARRFEQAWYRDPDTGQIQDAWRGSMEFIGRPLEEV